MNTRHMFAHDQLPSEVRVMLTKLAFNFNAEHVLELHRRGYSAALIRQTLVQIECRVHDEAVRAGVVAP